MLNLPTHVCIVRTFSPLQKNYFSPGKTETPEPLGIYVYNEFWKLSRDNIWKYLRYLCFPWKDYLLCNSNALQYQIGLDFQAEGIDPDEHEKSETKDYRSYCLVRGCTWMFVATLCCWLGNSLEPISALVIINIFSLLVGFIFLIDAIGINYYYQVFNSFTYRSLMMERRILKK